jgi:hypothetical protein
MYPHPAQHLKGEGVKERERDLKKTNFEDVLTDFIKANQFWRRDIYHRFQT